MRKKLYKAGKFWVASMAGAVIFAGSEIITNSLQVSADETQVSKATDTTVGNNTDQLKNNNGTQEQQSSDANAKQDTDKQSDSSNVTGATIQANGMNGTQLTVQNYASSDGEYHINESGETTWILKDTGEKVTGLVKIGGSLQYFDVNTGIQVKDTLKTITGDTYYFQAGSGNAAIGTAVVNGKLYGFDQDAKQVKGDFVTNSDGKTYYFDKSGNTLSGLQPINGQLYYFETDGQVRKGTAEPVVVDGVEYYLDKTDGHATIGNKEQFHEELTIQNSDYTEHNQLAEVNQQSIDNVDGHITADSWYRPKDILVNGETWTASQSTDRRPLLMGWWPDKATQTAYVNFMIDQGLLQKAKEAVNVDQTTLNDDVQKIQVAIEKRISAENSTDWLKTLMNTFVKSQSQWNSTSEKATGTNDGFQGGWLTYQNSDQTTWANSSYRYLNRTLKNQLGQIKNTNDSNAIGGYELLLANDIDNSNPAVQAEQLNWLYYLLNFGSISNNNANANFDGYRVDAVDNVDADLLDIASQLMKEIYGTNKNDSNANQHLSILEDWAYEDFQYIADKGSNQLTMDFKTQVQLVSSLTADPYQRDSMQRFLEWNNINRSVDNTEDTQVPNYSFIRAHDSHVQDIIAKIVEDLYPGANGLTPTAEQMAQAFKIYNADQNSATKKYTMYNIPASYAMLLTNKDTVPRVYYGDLYTDDGEYMANQSPYYSAITQLMKDRIKYVSGGQTMATGTTLGNGQKTNRTDVLTSVRFGKDLMNVTDSDASAHNQRTDGVGVIISNNPKFKLADNEEVVLHMGAAHRNQEFRASILSTNSGLHVYDSDIGAPTAWTDDNGDLHFNGSWIYGVTDTQVSGYLAVWVPVGAASNQDVRSLNDVSTETSTDGKTFHSNASLDSNLIYEGFSNFQSSASTDDEYTNVKIANNANLFASWGVTSFEFAPQYRSSSDTSFLDAIIQNGYAIQDRYDLGYDKSDGTKNPTKYGTAEQLRKAIQAVHAAGIQAMADFVPNQIYNLPNEQAVTVDRTDVLGIPAESSLINHTIYIANSLGTGTDYQSIYGGAFLNLLKAKYPNLFKTVQLSNGKTLGADEKITTWSAKYLNGTNVLGRGSDYVLGDKASKKYFLITADGQYYLPNQLTNKITLSGFARDENGTKFYSLSGYQAFDAFIQDESGNYYYFNDKGYMVYGEQYIRGTRYVFGENGILLSDTASVKYADKNKKYPDTPLHPNPGQTLNGYLYDGSSKNDGYRMYKDSHLYSGKYDFDGSFQYFVNGVLQKNTWLTLDGHIYYMDQVGRAVQGHYNLNGQDFDFSNDGILQSSGYLYDGSEENGGYRWYEDGQLFTGFRYYMGTYYWFVDGVRQNAGFRTAWGLTYYTDSEGRAVQGVQTINGSIFDFGNDGSYFLRSSGYLNDGSSANGGYRWYENGQLFTGFRYYMGTYYWFVDGVRQNAGWREAWGMKYYTDQDGRAVQGTQVIDGQVYNFGDDGSYYERPVSGYIYDGSDQNGGYRWYENGQLFTGFRYYMGTYYWFVDGVRQNAGWREAWGMKYYTDQDGRAVQGWQNIDGQNYYFGDDDTYYLR